MDGCTYKEDTLHLKQGNGRMQIKGCEREDVIKIG